MNKENEARKTFISIAVQGLKHHLKNASEYEKPAILNALANLEPLVQSEPSTPSFSKLRLHVLVGQYQGVVDEVSVHLTDEAAEKAFLKFTDGLTQEKLEELEEQDPMTDYGCTRIYEVEMQDEKEEE